MSFVISVSPFMQVNLVDIDGAPVEAFTVTPTARTRRVMDDHAIVFRAGASGLSLYYKSNPEVPAPPVSAIQSRTRFSFAMHLDQPDFFARFHPDFADNTAQILLDNLDGVGAISASGTLSAGATVETADLIAAGPNPYPARLDLSGGAPAEVEAQNRFTGAVVGSTDVLVEPGALATTVPVEVPDTADAALRLFAPAPSTLNRLIYADTEVSDAGAAGAIDLYWDQAQTAVPAGTGAVFTAEFRPRP